MKKRTVVGQRGILMVGTCLFAAGLGLTIGSTVVMASGQGQSAASPSSPSSTAGQSKSQYSQLPDGPGKDTLVRVCGKCHSPTNVIANGQSREGWEAEISKMAGLGAAASDEEFTEILDYVVKNFPPATAKVNMNKATAKELETQLGLTSKQAEGIVAYREKSGPFKTIDDVKKVPEIEAKEIDVRRNRMAF